jgi:hypothetical protein
VLLVAAASDGVTLSRPTGHQSSVACGCCFSWCHCLTLNSTKMLLLLATASGGVVDFSSHFAAVPHLRPDAMVQKSAFHSVSESGKHFCVCDHTLLLQSEGTAMTVTRSCLLLASYSSHAVISHHVVSGLRSSCHAAFHVNWLSNV